MEPARVVVGIPSYRNLNTVGAVVQIVAEGLDQHFQHLDPVLVSTDGHSFDQTLDIAMATPVTSTVRRVGTRYHGLPGKGSAIRSILEIAVSLGARACAIVEADVTSIEPDWIPALVGPVLSGEYDMIVPRYFYQRPLAGGNDLLAAPFLQSLFGTNLCTPLAGEFAVSGFLAGRMSAKDVWETDVARAGINVWLSITAILDGFKLGQVRLGERIHQSPGRGPANGKFIQQVGTLFRLAWLYRRRQREGTNPPPIPLHGRWPPRSHAASNSWPSAAPVLAAAHKGVGRYINSAWPGILLPETLAKVRESFVNEPYTFPPDLWAQIVYDFFVVYNKGDGDPDRVIEALFPLYHARLAAFLEAGSTLGETGREALIEEQAASFRNMLPCLLERWATYVPWSS